jgi:hypothetical protein
MVVPWLVASATSGFDSSSTFFTDGSKDPPFRELILVYTILVVPSPAFVLGHQVEWAHRPGR